MTIIILIVMQMVLLIMMFMMVLPDNDNVDHVDFCVDSGQNKHDDEEGGRRRSEQGDDHVFICASVGDDHDARDVVLSAMNTVFLMRMR